jgi:hypothetical protein
MACEHEGMGLRFGLERDDLSFKRKFRYLFQIAGISALDIGSETNALPHRRGARPSLGWKEFEFQHLNESIWYPLKPDWKPVQLHLYDLRCNQNPVFDWIRYTDTFIRSGSPASGIQGIYDPENGTWRPIVDAEFKRNATLKMLGGCGETIEEWRFEGCYPHNIEWGELDMDNSDLVTVDIQLRYDRAFLVNR